MVVRAAGRRGAVGRAGGRRGAGAPPSEASLRVGRAAGPAGGWGPRARGERYEEARRPRRAYKSRTMKISGTDADVIDALVGITPGSSLDAIRARRPEARAHAQATDRALFAPEAPGNVTAQERV